MENDAYARTLDQVADEMVFFLRHFVEVYPEYKHELHSATGGTSGGVDVYLAGESLCVGRKRLDSPQRRAVYPVHGTRATQGGRKLAGEALRADDREWVYRPDDAVWLRARHDGGERRVERRRRGTLRAEWRCLPQEYERIKPTVDQCRKVLRNSDRPRVEYDECSKILTDIIEVTRKRCVCELRVR